MNTGEKEEKIDRMGVYLFLCIVMLCIGFVIGGWLTKEVVDNYWIQIIIHHNNGHWVIDPSSGEKSFIMINHNEEKK